jgi:surface protein
VSKVTDMGYMFNEAAAFNQDIGRWDVSAVTNMGDMFEEATAFNQDLGDWNVSAVTDMGDMFDGADSLSDYHKGLIHASFSSNVNWPYDWSAFVGTPSPVENNATDPPVTQVYLPIVRTESAGQSTDGQPLLEGMILNDGGSAILEKGFILSQQITFQDSIRLPAEGEADGASFSASAQLEPDKLHYFRAYAINARGESLGSIQQFSAPEQSDAWWAQMPAVGAGWRNSSWLGTFRPYDNGWIYHAKLGWAYAHPDGSGGLWLWFRDHHWMWTRSGVFPYLWKHDLGSWLYLLGTRNGQPVFFDFATGSVR